MAELTQISTLPCVAPLCIEVMADAFALVLAEGDQPEKVLLHPRDYADLLKVGRAGLLSESLTLEEKSQMLSDGKWPKTLWGAEAIRTLEVEAGMVHILGSSCVVKVEVYR